jgi:hypothetical protein
VYVRIHVICIMIINQSEKLIIRNENRYRIQSSPLARAYDGRPSMRTMMSMSTVGYCIALLMNEITKTWVTV